MHLDALIAKLQMLRAQHGGNRNVLLGRAQNPNSIRAVEFEEDLIHESFSNVSITDLPGYGKKEGWIWFEVPAKLVVSDKNQNKSGPASITEAYLHLLDTALLKLLQHAEKKSKSVKAFEEDIKHAEWALASVTQLDMDIEELRGYRDSFVSQAIQAGSVRDWLNQESSLGKTQAEENQ